MPYLQCLDKLGSHLSQNKLQQTPYVPIFKVCYRNFPHVGSHCSLAKNKKRISSPSPPPLSPSLMPKGPELPRVPFCEKKRVSFFNSTFYFYFYFSYVQVYGVPFLQGKELNPFDFNDQRIRLDDVVSSFSEPLKFST